ncbi:M24 family metallopeptidase [Candidatus Woesearchaeota archaeon]|nr:M24 family metallopeptidase [Candidatus Woesearchaeota archaeon]
MVITIEPGVYQSPIGVRIEDTVVVQDKPKVLTNLTKELVTI